MTKHYQIQYFDKTSIAWKFDRKNYATLRDAKAKVEKEKVSRFVEITMPKNIIKLV